MSWGTCASCPNARLDVPPVRRINEYTKLYEVIDYSLPGATTRAALRGSPGLPFDNFKSQMETSQEKITLLRFGGADALLDIAEFEQNLRELVKLVRLNNKTPIITGIVYISNPDTRVDAYNEVAKSVAQSTGTKFIDLRSLPYKPEDSVDGLHPTQEYSDRISKLIADMLQP